MPEGQRDFMAELLGTMNAMPRVLGVLYEDPIMIASRKVGRALTVLDIWKRYTS